MPKVGSGQFIYDLIEGWGELPPDLSFGVVADVAVDSRDRLYCFQRKDPPVIVLDSSGNYLTSWGDGTMAYAHGISVGPDDNIYLIFRDDHIALKCTPDGDILFTIGTRGKASDVVYEGDFEDAPRGAVKVTKAGGPFNRPCRLVQSPSGDLYAADGYSNARIHRFSAKGDLKSSWGEPGTSEPGQFHVPHSVLVDKRGVVYVCDRENNRIQMFTGDGEFITEWTDLLLPTDIYQDASGNFFVTEITDRFSVLDQQGRLLAHVETVPGHGVAGDSKGNIYMAEAYGGRLDKFVKRS